MSDDGTTVPSPTSKRWDRVYRNRFRITRFSAFLALVDDVLASKTTCRILDMGGVPSYWQGLRDLWEPRPLDITLVNPQTPAAHLQSHIFTLIQGDARSLPGLPDDAFDIVHSNSTIEHVGGWRDMRAMASEVRRLAPAYFVQTPNFWFPLEPHMRTPFVHWLPRPWQRRIVSARACGFYTKAETLDAAHNILDDANLIDATEMAALFPDAKIIRETVGFLTKSFIAVRQNRLPTQ